MTKYDELWRALTPEAQDGLRAAALREDLDLTLHMLADDDYGDEDKADFAKDLNFLWGVAKRWMTRADYEALQDELYGSDTPSGPEETEVTVLLDSSTFGVLERAAELDGRTPAEVARSVLCVAAAKVELGRD